MKVREITIEMIKHIAYSLAKQTMDWNEPIPEFETRFPNVLESSIAVPFQKFDQKFLYDGLIGKASVLFYLLIKNHPFQNGNKRIAVTVLLIFLYLNKKWIKADETEFYNFARLVAQSLPEMKNQMIESIENFIKKRLIDSISRVVKTTNIIKD